MWHAHCKWRAAFNKHDLCYILLYAHRACCDFGGANHNAFGEQRSLYQFHKPSFLSFSGNHGLFQYMVRRYPASSWIGQDSWITQLWADSIGDFLCVKDNTLTRPWHNYDLEDVWPWFWSGQYVGWLWRHGGGRAKFDNPPSSRVAWQQRRVTWQPLRRVS